MGPTLVQRTQTGVRIETSLLKVLKGLAEYTELTLGDLLEALGRQPGCDVPCRPATAPNRAAAPVRRENTQIYIC